MAKMAILHDSTRPAFVFPYDSYTIWQIVTLGLPMRTPNTHTPCHLGTATHAP
jgi:hypothetical protein